MRMILTHGEGDHPFSIESSLELFDRMMTLAGLDFIWFRTDEESNRGFIFDGEPLYVVAWDDSVTWTSLDYATKFSHPRTDGWIKIDRAKVSDPEYLEQLAVAVWERIEELEPKGDE